MIREAIEVLTKGDLSNLQMEMVMEEIMTGTVETPLIVDFLTGLSKKGETAEELASAVKVMRKHAVKVKSKYKIILDTCGTGGDKKHTFNISTAAAFVASGCGIAVAKHGNRSVSSKSGSADCLEALGININISKEKAEKCLNQAGIVFLFAQNFHPAMKFAMQARKQIADKTIFNFLGPLSNPANATHQLVGVYDFKRAQIVAEALAELGTEHALVVRAADNTDEISTVDKTHILEIRKHRVEPEITIDPDEFGLKGRLSDFSGGTASENAQILLDILNNRQVPCRNIVILNAAAAIYAADKTKARSLKDGIREGIKLAEESLGSGMALKKLNLLKDYSDEKS